MSLIGDRFISCALSISSLETSFTDEVIDNQFS